MGFFDKKFTLLVLFICFLLNLQSVLSLGVSPGFIDLGEVEIDSTRIVRFHVIAPSDRTSLVKLEAEEGNIDFFKRDAFKDMLYEYSEQTISSWVEFLHNPVEINPDSETLKTHGGGLRAWKEVNFILKIPEDADPGYHLLVIRPIPITPTGKGPADISIVAVVPLTILFRVEGEAIRDGRILDVVSGGFSGNRLVLDIFFQNKGTVTMSSRADDIKIYDDSGNPILSVLSNMDYLKPNEMKTLKAYIDSDKLDLGTYKVLASVDFITGRVSKESTVTLEEVPPVVPEVYEFPYWILIIPIIILIAYIIYKWGE